MIEELEGSTETEAVVEDSFDSCSDGRVQPCEDFYCYLIEANKASLVSLVADEVISPKIASRTAEALVAVARRGE